MFWEKFQNISSSILSRLAITHNIYLHSLKSLKSWAIIKIKITKLDDDDNYLSFILKVLGTFKNIFKTLHDLNGIDEKTKMLKNPS